MPGEWPRARGRPKTNDPCSRSGPCSFCGPGAKETVKVMARTIIEGNTVMQSSSLLIVWISFLHVLVSVFCLIFLHGHVTKLLVRVCVCARACVCVCVQCKREDMMAHMSEMAGQHAMLAAAAITQLTASLWKVCLHCCQPSVLLCIFFYSSHCSVRNTEIPGL